VSLGRRLSALALLALLAGCGSGPTPRQAPVTAPPSTAQAEDRLVVTPVDFSDLPGWHDDALAEALPALRRSCDKITRLNPTQPVGYDGRGGLAGDWMTPCGALGMVNEGDHEGVRSIIETWFQPYRASAGPRADGLFTGYCEAELRGSRQQGGAYRFPLYARPAGWAADPVKAGAKSYSRAEIEAGALTGKAQVILWVDDLVDAHILHIQGSGRVVLDDGSVVHVSSNGTNGQEWVGLGKILMAHGKLAPGESSMQSVRAWLRAHPAEAAVLMAENPRYVFFRFVDADGPVGAEGVALTPGRSLAVDPRFIPYGVPLWLDTMEPGGKPLRRLMVAQDTGKAITGPVRGDIFWGAGEAAFDVAGRMKSRGGYYLLLPRQHSPSLVMN
jgi:membrane-bound lytic murein transglycosylase A